MRGKDFCLFSNAMGSSMVDVKVDKPNDRLMPGSEHTNSKGQQPGSNSSVGELLLFIY